MRARIEGWVVGWLMVLAFVTALWPAVSAGAAGAPPTRPARVVCADRRSPACADRHNPYRVQPNGRPIPYQPRRGW